MGLINVYNSLDNKPKTHTFNGKISDNLSLDWKYTKIFLGSKELNHEYSVNEDDVVMIQVFPGATTAALVVGIVSLVVAGITGTIAIVKAKQAERDMKRALEKLKKQSNRQETESIAWLSGGRNERVDGKQAPIILGRHLFTPYYLSDPYLRPYGEDGEELAWYAPFICGQSGLNIEEVRNGATVIKDINGNTETTGRFYFSEIGSDYGYETQANLINVIQQGWFEEYEYYEKGIEEPFYSNDMQIFNQKWVDSLESSVELGRKQSETQVVDGIFVNDDGEEPIVRETAKFPMRAEVEIMVDGLAGWDSNHSVDTEATVEVLVEWSTDQTDWHKIDIEGWEHTPEKDILTRAKNRQMRFLATVDFQDYASQIYSKEGTPVYIRATRLSRMHTGGYRDRVYLTAIRTKLYSPKKSSTSQLVEAKNLNEQLTDKFCRMGIKIKVNKNTQDVLDRFSIVASMTGRTWNGTEWVLEQGKKVKTSNPAAVALEVLTGLIHTPSKLKDSEIDLQSFGELYEYCENQEVLIEGIQRFKLESNGVLTTATRKVDVLQQIMMICDGGIYVNEYGTMVAFHDHRQENPIALLNPQRLISMVENRDLNRKADGYNVEFIDQDSDWSTVTHQLLKPRVEEDVLNTFTSIKYDYVTSYYHAMWLARRMMAKEIHRPGTITVNVGKEGRYYRPGSLIKVQHEGFKIGIGSGEVVNNLIKDKMIIGVRCMEHFALSLDRDYWIDLFIVRPDRKPYIIQKKIRSTGTYTNELYFTVPEDTQGTNWELQYPSKIDPNSPDAPKYGDIVSVKDGEIEEAPKVWEAKRYLVTGLSENQQGYELSLVEYSDSVYSAPTDTVIPERFSSIIRANPPVYGGFESKPIFGDPVQTNVRDVSQIAEKIVEGAIPNIVAEKAPRYRGATSNAQYLIDNVGTINGNTMNLNDYIMYTGSTTGGIRANYIYQWKGDHWLELDREGNWEKYLDGISDITTGAPDGVFSTTFIKTLFAQTLNATVANILSRIVVGAGGDTGLLLDGTSGVIKSNYTPSSNTVDGSGFLLRGSDGYAEFNNIKAKKISVIDGFFTRGDFDSIIVHGNSTVQGTISGTLDARNLITSGSVVSGTTYLLKGNNNIIELSSDVTQILSETPLKQIRIFATGSCTLRLKFPSLRQGVGSSEYNLGQYKVTLNGNTFIDWTEVYDQNLISQSDTREFTVNLTNLTTGNIIELYGIRRSSTTVYFFVNTTFELRCGGSAPPGLIGLLG